MKIVVYVTLLLLILTGCIERYDTKIEGIESILVVEGIITGGTTQITLSKSVDIDVLYNDLVTVDNASVYVACDDGTLSDAAFSSGNGIYMIPTGELKTDAKYRLIIYINDTVYQSEFISPTITPPVDISFMCDDNDIYICVTTHGNDDQTGYYLWSFREDWEIHSYLLGDFIYVKTSFVPILADLHSPANKYYCWAKESSKTPILGMSENLIDNDMRERKIWSFPRTDDRTSVLYRVQVKQNRIHKEGYDFYNNVKKNIEQTGSVFSHIPAEISGNIKCISDPEIPVIGYVEVSTTTAKDIQYLNNKFWDPRNRNVECFQCLVDVIGPSPMIAPKIKPVTVLYQVTPTGAYYVWEYCVDCTMIGGSKIKPEDWPTDNL